VAMGWMVMQLLTDQPSIDMPTYRQTTHWQYIIRFRQLADNDNLPTVLGLKTTHRQWQLTHSHKLIDRPLTWS
jgi:hypothetical protein